MIDVQITRNQTSKMTEYFSVDRRGFYTEGGTLTLYKQNPIQNAPVVAGDFGSMNDVQSHLARLFPDGLSLHGWDYMTRNTKITPGSDGQHYVEYSNALEIFIEYVRRASFPGLHSRLQSYFAFTSAEEARNFSAKNGSKPVYKLHAERVFRYDQKWLRLGHQSAYTSYAAEQYWSGSATPEPTWEYLLAAPVSVMERIK
jgi:hypothetical protein